MIPTMTSSTQDRLARSLQLVKVGDYRSARRIAKQLLGDGAELTKEEQNKVDHILKVTGIDPYVAGGFLFTLCVLVFLLIKYVL